MNGQNRLALLVAVVCAVLVIVGFAFSVHLEKGIAHAARLEATQQSPVPMPSGATPAAHKTS